MIANDRDGEQREPKRMPPESHAGQTRSGSSRQNKSIGHFPTRIESCEFVDRDLQAPRDVIVFDAKLVGERQ
jgi:hypothetical protein